MYTVENVRKFVEESYLVSPEQAREILDRAERCSEGGVFSGGAIDSILGDSDLVDAFENAVQTEPEHIRLGLAAIAKTFAK